MNRVNKLKSVAPKSDITLPNNAPKTIQRNYCRNFSNF